MSLDWLTAPASGLANLPQVEFSVGVHGGVKTYHLIHRNGAI